MSCVYTLKGPDGETVRLSGIPALKAWLATGDNLASLLPQRAAEVATFRRAPLQNAVNRAINPERVAMVERMGQGIAARWKNPPKVVVFNEMQDQRIPQEVRDEDARQKAGGAVGEPEGFFYQGTIYLNASEIPTAQDAARVLFHEGLGHYGLRGVFGQSMNAVLEQIVTLRKADVIAKAKEYGLDPENRADMLTAAEEVLAFMAQSKPESGFVQRAIAAIRTWIRQNVPGMGNIELSDAEIIRDYIMPARAFVEQGGRASVPQNGTAFSRAPATDSKAFRDWFGDSKVTDAKGDPLVVYHGTTQDVAEFSDEWIGEGNGSADWGDGFYFASKPAAANTYAEGEGGNVMPVYLSIKKPAGKREMKSRRVMDALDDGYFDSARDVLTEMGHDGIIIDHGKDGKEYVVFSPTQIKSATGNRGTFDPANPDIRFSRAKPKLEPAKGLKPAEQGLLRRVQSAIQDNLNRVRQVQERIVEITGRPIPELADYYGAETNRPGRIAARLEDARNRLTGPLMEKLAKAGYKPEQLSELLHAMHAQERNERIAEINPEMPDGGSGMTTAEANALLAKYKGETKLQALANDARKIARATLDLKLAYGLIDKNTHETLSTVYQNYVPLKGDGEYGPKIKRAMGHDGRDEFILENLARDYDQAVVVGEKNLARQSLLAMVLQNPDPELWSVGVPPRGRFVAGKTYDVLKDGKPEATFTSEAQVSAFLEGKGAQAVNYEVRDSAGERVQTFVKPLQDNEVMVYVEGRPVRIQIKGDELLAKQIRPLDQGQMNVVLETMRGVQRYLSRIYTAYNPTFIITNPLRDIQTGTINIMGNQGAAVAARAWSNYPAAIKALASFASTKKVPDGQMGKWLKEYRDNGGKTGASWMSDLEEQGQTLRRMYDDAYGATGYLKDGKAGKAALIAGRKVIGGMAHVIEIANQATENALRLGLYVALRENGASAGEAAQAAKNVTVNFDRKGTQTGVMSALYLFFNPAVQGTANALRTVFKGENKQQAWAALGGLALLGAWAAGQGIDDDEDRWLGEDWGVRAKKLVMNIGGNRIVVPLSLEFAPFFALGVALEETRRGAMSATQASAHIISSFIDSYIPFRGLYSADSNEPGLDVATAASPTVLRPFLEAAMNRNAFGSKIVPENEYTKDRADNLKMNRNTKGTVFDEASQGLAKAGEAMGAGRYENDITKVSPEMLRHFWRTYTGGLGTFITDMASLGKIAAEDPSIVEMADVPVAKAFATENNVRPIRGRYYKLTDEARTAATEFKEAKKAGDDEAMNDILNQPKKAELLSLGRLIQKTNEASAAIRDEMATINADKKMALAEKRAQLKELEKREEELYRAAISAFR